MIDEGPLVRCCTGLLAGVGIPDISRGRLKIFPRVGENGPGDLTTAAGVLVITLSAPLDMGVEGGGDLTGRDDAGLGRSATDLSPAADVRLDFANELAVGARSRDDVDNLEDEEPVLDGRPAGVREDFFVPILPVTPMEDIRAEDRRVPMDDTLAELTLDLAVPDTEFFREVMVGPTVGLLKVPNPF